MAAAERARVAGTCIRCNEGYEVSHHVFVVRGPGGPGYAHRACTTLGERSTPTGYRVNSMGRAAKRHKPL